MEKHSEEFLTIKIPKPKILFGSESKATHGKQAQKQHKLLYFILSGIFLFLFYAFSVIVKSKALMPFDFDMTVKIQQHVPLRLDSFFSFLSFLGNAEGATVILTVLLLLRKRIWSFLALGVYGAAHVVEIVGKNFLNHPGPPKFMLRSQASNFPQFYVYTSGSYPSGHSLRMIFIAIVAVAVIHGAKKIPNGGKLVLYGFVILYSCLMLFSRISLGEHWTTDVIAGSLLGASAGFFSLIFV